MQNKNPMSTLGNTLGIISLVIPTVILILILNWLFKITPFQRLEGFAVMVTPFICPIAIILAIISLKINPNKLGKWGIIINFILFFAPYIYWHLGTYLFGV